VRGAGRASTGFTTRASSTSTSTRGNGRRGSAAPPACLTLCSLSRHFRFVALNAKQSAFVREYLKDPNATQAAKRAGYSAKTAYAQGSALLKHPEVSAAVGRGQERLGQKAEVTAVWILENLREVAERCLQKVPVMVRDGKDMRQATDVDGEGVWEFDSGGANRSLELLGKHLKMFTDKIEHSGEVSFSLVNPFVRPAG
jgi:phage terminase small subunit